MSETSVITLKYVANPELAEEHLELHYQAKQKDFKTSFQDSRSVIKTQDSSESSPTETLSSQSSSQITTKKEYVDESATDSSSDEDYNPDEEEEAMDSDEEMIDSDDESSSSNSLAISDLSERQIQPASPTRLELPSHKPEEAVPDPSGRVDEARSSSWKYMLGSFKQRAASKIQFNVNAASFVPKNLSQTQISLYTPHLSYTPAKSQTKGHQSPLSLYYSTFQALSESQKSYKATHTSAQDSDHKLPHSNSSSLSQLDKVIRKKKADIVIRRSNLPSKYTKESALDPNDPSSLCTTPLNSWSECEHSFCLNFRSQSRMKTYDPRLRIRNLPLEIRLRIGLPPRKSLTPYQLYLKESVQAIRQMKPGIEIAEIVEMGLYIWIFQVSQAQKQIYEDKSSAALRNYFKELELYRIRRKEILQQYKIHLSFQSPNAEDQGAYPLESNKFHSRPKYKTPYKLFKMDHSDAIQAEQPDATFKERSGVLKQRWKELPTHSKYLYVQRSYHDRKRWALILF